MSLRTAFVGVCATDRFTPHSGEATGRTRKDSLSRFRAVERCGVQLKDPGMANGPQVTLDWNCVSLGKQKARIARLENADSGY